MSTYGIEIKLSSGKVVDIANWKPFFVLDTLSGSSATTINKTYPELAGMDLSIFLKDLGASALSQNVDYDTVSWNSTSGTLSITTTSFYNIIVYGVGN